MSGRKKAYVETYGCQMNISDGELMSGILASDGYDLVDTPEQADVVLVNTCAIREHAEQRVLGRVAQLNGLKEENPELVIGVTGCMAQRMGEELFRKAPYVDLVMGPDGYRALPQSLATVTARGDVPEPTGSRLVKLQGVPNRDGRKNLSVLGLDDGENYEGLELRRVSSVAAWVPIQRGCDHRCTFCIVPYVRGPEKNRAPDAVLEEIRQVVKRGISEVTLLGQTVNSYRFGDVSFSQLLRRVARIEGIRRVRFTSPHPNDVTSELVGVMAEEPAICEQLHLPLQAGNDRTLKRMLRRHSVDQFLEKVELVREAIPDIALSTDVIVAFPGETDEEFRDTLEVLDHVRFDEAFTYRYSPRDGTPATRLPKDQWVPEEEGKARLNTLIERTRRIQREINEGEVGRIEDVLVEKRGKGDGDLLGRTRRNKAVAFPGDPDRIGAYLRVRLDRTTGATFVGSVHDDQEGSRA